MPPAAYETTTYWKKLIGQSMTRFLLLRALRSGPVYGYVLPKAIADITDDLITPSEGTLYTALSQYQQQGLITVEERVVNGRTQKIYKLTDSGRAAFRTATATFGRLLPILRKLTTL